MFEWLFGPRPKPEPDPPTDKQIRYARKLGLPLPENVDSATVSQMIGEAEARDPALKTNRELANVKRRKQKFGEDKVNEESKWNAHADAGKWMSVVFTRGKSRLTDVVRLNGAYIDDKGKIKIEAEVMKITNDRYAGRLVDAGRNIEIPAEKIDWHEIIDEIDVDDVRAFELHLAGQRHFAS